MNKQEQIDFLNDEVDSLRKLLHQHTNENKNLKEENQDLKRENQELKHLSKEGQDHLKYLKMKETARLEAMKMLFSVMEGGSTHRQKAMFAFQSKSVIDEEMNKINLDYNLDGTLPF